MPGQIRGSLALALAALIGGALLGCSHKAAPASAQAPPPFATSPVAEENFDKQDPCNLLDPKEVEAVLGAPLAVPPYRSGNGDRQSHSPTATPASTRRRASATSRSTSPTRAARRPTR